MVKSFRHNTIIIYILNQADLIGNVIHLSNAKKAEKIQVLIKVLN